MHNAPCVPADPMQVSSVFPNLKELGSLISFANLEHVVKPAAWLCGLETNFLRSPGRHIIRKFKSLETEPESVWRCVAGERHVRKSCPRAYNESNDATIKSLKGELEAESFWRSTGPN